MEKLIPLEIPIGGSGFTGTKNMSSVKPDALIIALNICYENGVISKEGGSAKYNSTPISGQPKILSGVDWFPAAGNQRMVVYTSNGDLLKDSGTGAFSVTLKSGLSTTAFPVFVEGGLEAAGRSRKLFCFNGVDAPQVLAGDGITTANLATPTADWSGANQPSWAVLHKGRMWAGGNSNDPHRVYYSLLSDHEAFTGGDTGSMSVYPGEGEKIVGAISYKGLLLVFKSPLGVYVINTTDTSSLDWGVARITPYVGMSGPGGLVVLEDDVLFVDSSGQFQTLSAVVEFGNVGGRNLSKVVRFQDYMKENFNLQYLNRVRSVYYAHRQEAHFAIAGIGSSINNSRIVWDFSTDLPRVRYSDKDTCESLWLRKDSIGIVRPVVGDATGTVWNLDRATKDKAGAGYSSQFQTPHLDFGYLDPALSTKFKNAQFLAVQFEPLGQWDVYCDVFIDGNYTQTIVFTQGTAGSVLGSFVLGTDRLGGQLVVNKRKRCYGSGRRFSFLFRQSGAGQDFSISKAYLYCTIAEERDR